MKKNDSPNESTQQFTRIGTPNEAQKESDERHVNASLHRLQLMFLKHSIGSQKRDGHKYQENNQKMMQQKEASSINIVNEVSKRE